MDQHGVNTMGMQGGMSMPMSMAMPSGANGSNNPQTIGMGMNSAQYGVPLQQQQQQQQQQHMMMNMNAMNGMNQMNMGSMPMKMNPNAMNQTSAAGNMQTPAAPNAPGADWRIQLTREHRANLIAKIYNEMVRVSADPVPGIKLWMNVSWYELTLYKESLTQEEYINKIFTRLKSLRAQQTDMNAVMAAQTLPNQGMLSRLDFSYYNSLNLNQRAGGPGTNGGQVGGYPGHPQFGGPSGHPGAQQAQPGKPMPMASGGMPATSNGATSTPQAAKTEAGVPGAVIAEYWRQHAALKTKYHDDVEKVHNAFKKYVDHMKGHDETEQKKKLRYLLSYVQLCASILNEDKSTHPPRKIDELDKVYKYIVKIVNPYLKKLRTETDKRSFTPPNTGGPSAPSTANPAASSGAPNSASVVATSANAPGGFNGAMNMQQQGGSQQPQSDQQQQNSVNASSQNQSLQQKQQQYLMQQRAQQMQQQQQRMQAARQQQMMQQQQMMHQQKGVPTSQPQPHINSQQANQVNLPKQQQNNQVTGNQQTAQQPTQQKQQQINQQGQREHQASSGQAPQPQQPTSQQQHQHQHEIQTRGQSQQQQQKPQGQPQPQSQPGSSQQQHAQQPAAASREGAPLNVGLDDSLYGGMDSSGLLQMPSNLTSSASSSSFMGFSNDLSPTNFSSMDLLDMDGSGLSGLTYDGHDGNNSSGASGRNSNGGGGNNVSGGDSSDLGFLEAL